MLNIKKIYKHNIMNKKIVTGGIVKLQSYARGSFLRKNNYKLKDAFSLNIIESMLDSFIMYTNSIVELNKNLNNKRIRKPNFPSEISENIIKFVFRKKYKICPNWDTVGGDLQVMTKKIEVKAFSSSGPTSFGPNEKWDMLYFIDCCNYQNKIFKVYEVNLPNTSLIFRSLMINKNETFAQQCAEKRRPRLTFEKIKKQLPSKNCKLIFNDHFRSLL